jgi:aspartate aminotransferase-like enzyme
VPRDRSTTAAAKVTGEGLARRFAEHRDVAARLRARLE